MTTTQVRWTQLLTDAVNIPGFMLEAYRALVSVIKSWHSPKQTAQPTCEQLIDEQLRGRREWLNPVLDTIKQCKAILDDLGTATSDMRDPDSGEEEGLEAWQDAAREAREQEISEHVLSIDTTTTYRLCLMWGGPADYFELDWNQGGWAGGRYIYQDWFDGANRNIGPEEAERLAEQFGIYPDA